MWLKSLNFLIVTCSIVWSFQAVTAETVRPLEVDEQNQLSLSDSAGKRSFFEVMTMKNGIRAKLDDAYTAEFNVADAETALKAREKFSDKVSNNVLKKFTGDRNARLEAFGEFVDKIAGKKTTQKGIKALIEANGIRPPWSIADFLSMASGSTVLVHLDRNNYYYNTSYQADEVNSGRSFGAGPSHKADDASYPFYLGNLRAYFEDNDDLSPFYTAIMEILTQSDPSNLGKMSAETITVEIDGKETEIDGQTLVTDFITVYTAELYRHLNSDLKKHDWENALAELTFVSAYSEKAELVQNVKGDIVKGNPSDWRYVGTEGSGIGGKQGIERRKFQAKVCAAARAIKIAAIKTIDEITGQKADCFNGVMRYLNNLDTQASVKRNAKKLTSAMVKLLAEIRSKSDAMTAKIPGAP